MNSTEREIYDKYAYKKTHIYLVYEEFERRVNSTENEYDGLKKGECRFDYSSWEKRLNLTHKVMINSIKMLVKEEYIEQRVRGKKGTQSTYFLTRFLEQNWEQNKEQNWEQKKDSNINTLDNIKEQKEERNLEQKKVQSSIYNNLNIKSNINNIYYSSSEVEKEILENNKKIDEEELKADLKKDLIQKINSKYPKELIKEEFNKLKPKGLDTLDMLNELDKNLKSKNKIKKDKYSEDSKEYKLSILLRDLILERDSNSRCRNANMQSWSKYIDLLHRKDNRSYEDIENIIKWSQQDNFWKSNILSTQKLREKFDTLYQKYNSGQASHKNCNSNKLHDESEKDEYDWYWKNSFKIN